MDSALREKCVLALISTTRPQCKGHFGIGEARCALGLIGEAVLGMTLIPFWNDPVKEKYLGLEMVDYHRMLNEIGEVAHEIATRNNSGASFDELAKWLKEVPVDDSPAA